jgi:hypothetical protein
MTIDVTSNWTSIEAPHYTVTVSRTGFKMKAPSDANWHDGVEFRRDDQEDSYARTVDDFLSHFVLTDTFQENR